QHEIEHHIDSFSLDPERLVFVEERLSAIYDIARKHRITAEQLPELIAQLSSELAELQGGDARLDVLEQQGNEAERQYRQLAETPAVERRKAGLKQAKQVHAQLQKLGMENDHL